MSLEKVIKEDLPELLKLLKAKFSTASKTFNSDNGELIYDGELAIGVEVFAQDGMEACILKNKDKGMSAADAKAECGKGQYSKVPAPTKTYKHEDGTEVVVEAGKVVDIKKPKAPEPTDLKAMAEELFKAFPKTDLSAIEAKLAELKATIAEIQIEKTELKAIVDQCEGFKKEVISILEKFSSEPSAKSTQKNKTDSSKEPLPLEEWRKKFMQHQN